MEENSGHSLRSPREGGGREDTHCCSPVIPPFELLVGHLDNAVRHLPGGERNKRRCEERKPEAAGCSCGVQGSLGQA